MRKDQDVSPDLRSSLLAITWRPFTSPGEPRSNRTADGRLEVGDVGWWVAGLISWRYEYRRL